MRRASNRAYFYSFLGLIGTFWANYSGGILEFTFSVAFAVFFAGVALICETIEGKEKNV